jgi:hypothetical protein
MKNLILTLLLLTLTISASGCATILGGIIGHQSGEACAGIAIGAALDFGDDIAKAIGEAFGNKTVNVYSELGYVRIDAKTAREKCLKQKLEKRFAEASWKILNKESTSKTDKIQSCKYYCQTSDGREFTLEFFTEKKQDLRIYIKTTQENNELQSLITSRIGLWATEIIS